MLATDNSEKLLTRDQLASALTAAGFPVKPKTLANKAMRGDGPPFSLFGSRAIYRWDTALQWAHDQLRRPISEDDLRSERENER